MEENLTNFIPSDHGNGIGDNNRLISRITNNDDEAKLESVKEKEEKLNCFRYFMSTYPMEPIIIMTTIAATISPYVVGFFVFEHFEVSMNVSLNNTYEAEKAASKFLMFLSIAHTLPSLLVMLMLGPWSDIVGRKPVMYVGLLGCFMDGLITLNVILKNLDVSYLFLAEIISGSSGGIKAFMFGSFSFLVDKSKLELRVLRILIADALTIVVSAAVSIGVGFWIEYRGFLGPIILMAMIYALCLVYVFFITESKKVSPTLGFRKKVRALFHIEHLKNAVRLVKMKGKKGNLLRLTMLAFTVCLIAFDGRAAVSSLFMLQPPLSWTSANIGVFNGVATIITGIISLILTIVLAAKLIRFPTIAAIGLFSASLSILVTGLAMSNWVMYVAAFLGSLSIMGFPILRGYLSFLVLDNQQGALFSATSFLGIFAQFTASLLFTTMYRKTVDVIFPGFVFIVISFVGLISVILTLIARRMEQNIPNLFEQ